MKTKVFEINGQKVEAQELLWGVTKKIAKLSVTDSIQAVELGLTTTLSKDVKWIEENMRQSDIEAITEWITPK